MPAGVGTSPKSNQLFAVIKGISGHMVVLPVQKLQMAQGTRKTSDNMQQIKQEQKAGK